MLQCVAVMNAMRKRGIALLLVATCIVSTVLSTQSALAATPLAAEPLISRNVPAFTSDDCFGSKSPSLANDNDYSTYWRSCNASPSVSTPVTLTYDLSGVSSAQRSAINVVWYNDAVTGPYNPALISNNAYNIPGDYTLQGNTGAGGGSPPASGWVTLSTVTGNQYHSRQQALTFTGYNWLRLSVTASYGSVLNTDVALNMDVHSLAAGNLDNWVFFGDSITQAGFLHFSNYGNTFAQQINAGNAAYFPVDESGGVGGFTSADGAANIATWLAVDPAHFVTLNFGTNDANGGGVLLTAFKAHMKTMIDASLAAGRVVVIPLIPWGRTASLQANVPTLNAIIQQLYTEYPQIIPGPDLYTYFNNNQTLISNDDIHPTDPAGFTGYRTQWVNALATSIYTVPTLNATVAAGTYTTAQSVSLSMSKTGTIYYTLDGSTPTGSSTVYSAPIAISATKTLKAVAIDQAGNQSDVLNNTYTISTNTSGGGGQNNNNNNTDNNSNAGTDNTNNASANANNTTNTSSTNTPTSTQPTTTQPHRVSSVTTSLPTADQTTPAPIQPQSSDTTSPTTDTRTIEVTVTDPSGNPLQDVPVTLHSVAQTVYTNALGIAVFTNVALGQHTITIDTAQYRGSHSFTVDNSTVGTITLSLGVQSKTPSTISFSWLLVGIIGTFIIGVGVIILLALRRKRKAFAASL